MQATSSAARTELLRSSADGHFLPITLAPLKDAAKSLLQAARDGDTTALDRMARVYPGLTAGDLILARVQYAIAREYGFKNWAALKAQVEVGEQAHLAKFDRDMLHCLDSIQGNGYFILAGNEGTDGRWDFWPALVSYESDGSSIYPPPSATELKFFRSMSGVADFMSTTVGEMRRQYAELIFEELLPRDFASEMRGKTEKEIEACAYKDDGLWRWWSLGREFGHMDEYEADYYKDCKILRSEAELLDRIAVLYPELAPLRDARLPLCRIVPDR